ncbi:PAS domain S-box protein, partial [Myxococcota bacterium]|nr:PAS domain S-box protein [Myxococcota bacterium]
MWRYFSILALLGATLSTGLFQTWKTRENLLLTSQDNIHKTAYQTTFKTYQVAATVVVKEVINRPEITSLVRDAYKSSPEEKALSRERLHKMLLPTYERLTKMGFRQLHFHFPDNTSFIRFHRLDRYGDDLTDIRASVRQVNEEHKSVFGFENGRVFNGFRYVFPLSHEGQHVGSVETSVSFDAIRSSLYDAAPDHSFLFVLKKDKALTKTFTSEHDIYTPSEIHPRYVVEDLRSRGLSAEQPLSSAQQEINRLLLHRQDVRERMDMQHSFTTSLIYQDRSWLVSFLSIKNIIGEHVAYILAYEQSTRYARLWSDFKKIQTVLFSLLLLLSILTWKYLQSIKTLRHNESKLRAITQNMGDGLYVNDHSGQIIFANKTIEQILGYSADELLGQNAHTHLHRRLKDHREHLLDECPLMNATAEQKKYENENSHFRHKNGGLIPVEVKSTPLEIKKNELGSVVLFRDITERLRARNEILKVSNLESIGVLAGGLAHDFNNLLTTIIGNLELAKLCPQATHGTKESIQDALEASINASSLTKQLIVFAKGSAPIKEEVNLDSIIARCAKLVFEDKEINSKISLAENLWALESDAQQLPRVLRNLLTNAAWATGNKGQVTISVSNHIQEEDQSPHFATGKYILISVEDDGIGISTENLPRIFDPYFTTKPMGSTHGSGLGLS